VQAVGGLSHIVDWKAIVLGPQNSAIILTRDEDGDYATTADSELWIAQETEGVWAAPVRLTNNSVSDEHPTMFYDGFSAGAPLRLIWQQDGAIVYLADAQVVGGVPETLLPASVPVGPGFTKAFAGLTRVGGPLLLAWPEGDQIAFVVEGVGTQVSGGSMATPSFISLPSGDTVNGFKMVLTDGGMHSILTTTVAATAGSPTSIPVATKQRLGFTGVNLGSTGNSEIISQNTPVNVTIAVGSKVFLDVNVREVVGARYQWFHDGLLVPGATDSDFLKLAATEDDVGPYLLRVTDASGASQDYAAGTVNISETFAAWALAKSLTAPLNTREADADTDGAANELEYLFGTNPKDAASRPATYFLPAEASDIATDFDYFTFNVRAASTDCDFAIENSRDLSTWEDLRYVADLYGSNPRTITSTADGRTRNYSVLVPNIVSGSGDPLDPNTFRSFMRVRMISSE